MLDIVLALFVLGLLALGLRRPFLWVLCFLYVDIVAPQRISYFILAAIPLSLIVFLAAFGGWAVSDAKTDSRFTFRQGLMVALLIYCGVTTIGADFPVEALEKWSWVWKALVFAIFLPLTLRTRLRFEAVVLAMVLSIAAIIISGGIKTAFSGGGYGSLYFFVQDNTGLYEGSIISCAAISVIPLVLWLAKHGTVFPPSPAVKLFSVALVFSCLLIPVGTQARTGLLCIALLGVLSLRTAKNRFLYVALATLGLMIAIPFLPKSYTERMTTIENHEADQSASTRVAVWKWTMEYVKDHPFGGGFESFRSNKLTIETRSAATDGNTTAIEVNQVTDAARAFHSSYFEMLGEQGYFGLALWLWLHASGLWQMERLRARWRRKAMAEGAGPEQQWQAPLANALQQAQLVYLCGSLFVGIAFLPFTLMLLALQCGLWSYLGRIDSPRIAGRPVRPGLKLPDAVAAP